MNYRNVGQSGLKVSEISLGTWLTFGNQVDEELGQKLVRRAFEYGINYFDTADIYNKGQAEEMLGKALQGLNRAEYIIATKSFWPMSEAPTNKGLSRKHLFDSIEASLDRLKLKYVDIFYCHRFDPDTPLEETLAAIEDLIRLGKILYWGTSEWEADQISEAWALCQARQWHPPLINQPIYNMLNKKIEQRILPTTRRLGMGTAIFSPLSQGILSGKYTGGKIPQNSRGAAKNLNMFMLGQLNDHELLAKIDQLNPIAQRLNITLSQLAIAFTLHTPGVSTAIVGASSLEQLVENIGASGKSIPLTDLEQLRAMF
jgi:voltage-dependent potassium channel beta subunit